MNRLNGLLMVMLLATVMLWFGSESEPTKQHWQIATSTLVYSIFTLYPWKVCTLVWIRDESSTLPHVHRHASFCSSAQGRRRVFPAVPHWFTAYRPCLKPWAHATFRIATFSGEAWLILKDSLPDIFAVTAVRSTVNSGFRDSGVNFYKVLREISFMAAC